MSAAEAALNIAPVSSSGEDASRPADRGDRRSRPASAASAPANAAAGRTSRTAPPTTSASHAAEARAARDAEHVRIGERVAQQRLERDAGDRERGAERCGARDPRQADVEQDRRARPGAGVGQRAAGRPAPAAPNQIPAASAAARSRRAAGEREHEAARGERSAHGPHGRARFGVARAGSTGCGTVPSGAKSAAVAAPKSSGWTRRAIELGHLAQPRARG